MPNKSDPRFDEAIRRLGASLGIDLHAGDEGACALALDEQLVIVLTPPETSNRCGMHALLLPAARTAGGAVFIEALRLNLDLARADAGALLFADEAGGIVFSKNTSWTTRPESIVPDFHAFAAHARALRARLASILDSSPARRSTPSSRARTRFPP